MLDTTHAVETPEGVDLELRAAGPVPRIFAWCIDVAIYVAVSVILLIPMSIFGELGFRWWLVIVFALDWFYNVAFEMFFKGATPGKMVFGLAVVSDDGTPVNWAQSMLRNLLRWADMLPGMYGVGMASILLSRGFRRLGDHVAATLVIYNRRRVRLQPQAPLVKPLPPPVPLTIDEQRAVIGFSQRLFLLTRERATELATVAAPLVEKQPNAAGDPVTFLQGVAAWLLGQRPTER